MSEGLSGRPGGSSGSGRPGGSGTSTEAGLSWPEEQGDAKGRDPGKGRRLMLTAVILMGFGAVLAAVSAAQTAYFRFFVPPSEVRQQIVDALKAADQKINQETVGAMEEALTSMLAINIVAVGLWILIALTAYRGFGWARIAATVLAVLNVPWTVLMAPDLPHFAGVLVGLTAVLFLWMPASRDWAAAARPAKDLQV